VDRIDWKILEDAIWIGRHPNSWWLVDWRKPYGDNWLNELIAQFDTPSGWSDSYWKLIRRYTADPLPWENQPPFYQPYEE
jgi:hypothetical protein